MAFLRSAMCQNLLVTAGKQSCILCCIFASQTHPEFPISHVAAALQVDLIKAYHGGQVLSEQVAELKSYISAVADAELDGDDTVLAITAAHTAAYAVQLIKQSADPSCLPSKVRCNTGCPSSTLSALVLAI